MTTALITGCAGQDGSYLAELLLDHGHDVVGIIRRQSTPEHQESRISHLADNPRFITVYGDVTDLPSLWRIFAEYKPDFVFNLAAQSHVRVSFDVPHFTAQTNAIGVLNVLECVRQIVPNARAYQASSSEMWGTSCDPDGMQRETTPFHPVSPYGIAKLFGYHMTRHYRNGYGIFASNGILFNHESPRRGSNFVTAKVVKAAVEIQNGLREYVTLGNIDAKRDWGHSKDYVKAMYLILNATNPDDWVVATGTTRSVREMCHYVFDNLGLDFEKHVRFDDRLRRAQEVPYLCGDAEKIRTQLKWEPTYTFESLMDEIIEFWQGVICGR